jgi:subtilisin-like proprotein convertase family protein
MKLIHCVLASAFVLVVANVAQAQTCNNTVITINDNAPATPYPSNITVSGAPTSILTMTLTLNELTHTFPDDIQILLVGPGGQKYVFQNDAGAGDDVAAITYTLDDSAATALPDTTALTSGTFRPADYTVNDTVLWPAPAPVPPYNLAAPAGAATFTSVYGGTDANGVWSLYVVDDAAIDTGQYATGWCLTFAATPVELQSFEVN